MTVYNKLPIDALWDIVKSLADTIPIYREAMDEDENSTPESYLILRSDVSSGVELYGDGSAQIRRSDCDLILISKGKATKSTDTHNQNKALIAAALDSAGILYEGYNLGYDETLKSTEYTFSVTIYYR
jgi:hypothetical protein